jgi:hypothetical protein
VRENARPRRKRVSKRILKRRDEEKKAEAKKDEEQKEDDVQQVNEVQEERPIVAEVADFCSSSNTGRRRRGRWSLSRMR